MRLQSKAAGEASTGRRETQRAREDQSMKSHSLLQLTSKTKYFSCVLLTLQRGHKRGKSTQLSFGQLSFPTTSHFFPSSLSLPFFVFPLPLLPSFFSPAISFPNVLRFLTFPSPLFSSLSSVSSVNGGVGRTVVRGGGLIGGVMPVTFWADKRRELGHMSELWDVDVT